MLCVTHLVWLAVAACGPIAEPRPQAERVDGEALFRGILFGQGDIVTRVPELRDALGWRASLDDTQLRALDDFVDELTVAVRQTEPTFFKAFGDALQSGDHRTIDRMIDRASQVTLAALDRMPSVADWRAQLAANQAAVQEQLIELHNAGKLGATDLASLKAQLALLVAAEQNGEEAVLAKAGWAILVVVALAAVIVLPPVVLAVALAVVIAYAWAWPSPPDDGGTTLGREQIVDALATRLNAAPGTLR